MVPPLPRTPLNSHWRGVGPQSSLFHPGNPGSCDSKPVPFPKATCAPCPTPILTRVQSWAFLFFSLLSDRRLIPVLPALLGMLMASFHSRKSPVISSSSTLPSCSQFPSQSLHLEQGAQSSALNFQASVSLKGRPVLREDTASQLQRPLPATFLHLPCAQLPGLSARGLQGPGSRSGCACTV